MFDVFVATLWCPACGMLTTDAEMQTHIRGSSANSSTLGIGFAFDPYDVTEANILRSGYELVSHPNSNGPVRLLDVWICANCGTEQWAMVEITNRKIRGIEAVELDRATLESANFISEVNAELLAAALEGEKPVTGSSSVEILRRRLT